MLTVQNFQKFTNWDYLFELGYDYLGHVIAGAKFSDLKSQSAEEP